MIFCSSLDYDVPYFKIYLFSRFDYNHSFCNIHVGICVYFIAGGPEFKSSFFAS